MRNSENNPNSIFEKHSLSVSDIKSYLGISTSAAYELTHRKDFPVCRLGSSIRVPTKPFLAWIDAHTHMPAELKAAYTPLEVTSDAG